MTYQTTAGTEPTTDEQHEARTIQREAPEATHMMSEIGDGVFVQWGTCDSCHRRVNSCTCTDGPAEPAHITNWRTKRFEKSFGERGVEPALPEYLKHRDRRVNAVLRLLRSQGWTMTPPTAGNLNEYLTMTFVVRAPAGTEPGDDPRTLLTDDEIMFWGHEQGITVKALELGADPAMWHDDDKETT